MTQVRAWSSRTIDAPPERVYGTIADFRKRGDWLPSNFSNVQVEKGGEGAGTIFAYHFKAGSRERDYHMWIEEPVPGQVLLESDQGSSLTTQWTVEPRETGSWVEIKTIWQGAGGIGGIFERLFAPLALRRIYATTLDDLDRYVTGQPQGS